MAKVVIAKLSSKKKGKPSTVAEKRVRGSNGRPMQFFTIDANSPTFTEDLAYVFRRNVAAARLENVKLFGSPDGLRERSQRMKLVGSSNVRRKRKK